MDEIINKWLDCDIDEMQKIVSATEDPKALYLYAFNYNWDDGFEIPQAILDNAHCTLSTALLLFEFAEGYNYLLHKSSYSDSSPESIFIKNLYNSILNNKYPTDEMKYVAPLTRVDLYKLKKVLSEHEYVFLQNMVSVNLNYNV